MGSFFKSYLVGGRVLKTALAVTLAIFIAQQVGFERVTVAAIIALLTVQRSFYNSLIQSIAKLGSVLIGGLLGTAFSYLFGTTPLGYGLVTIIAIYICLRLNWQDNIVITSVTAITIIFSETDIPLVYSITHTATALLGAVCALGVNFLFTPNHRKEVLSKLEITEKNLRETITFIMNEMTDPGQQDLDFKIQINNLKDSIREGMEVAKLLREEQRFIITRETDSDRYRQAFHICKSQLNRLEEMHNLARRMPVSVPQARPLVRLFSIVRKVQYRRFMGQQCPYETIESLMSRLEESFARMELPRTRDEFISRASLFHLFQEIKRYYRRILNIPEGLLTKPLRR